MGKRVVGPYLDDHLTSRRTKFTWHHLTQTFGAQGPHMLSRGNGGSLLGLSAVPSWFHRAMLCDTTYTFAEDCGLGKLMEQAGVALEKHMFEQHVASKLHPELRRFLKHLAADERVRFYCERCSTLGSSYTDQFFYILVMGQDDEEPILLQGQPKNHCLGKPQAKDVVKELLEFWRCTRPGDLESDQITSVLFQLVQTAYKEEHKRLLKAYNKAVAVSNEGTQICHADWVVVIRNESGRSAAISSASSFKQGKVAWTPDSMQRLTDKHCRAIPETAEQVLDVVTSNLGRSRWTLGRRQCLIRGHKMDGQAPYKILIVPHEYCYDNYEIKVTAHIDL